MKKTLEPCIILKNLNTNLKDFKTCTIIYALKSQCIKFDKYLVKSF